MFYNNIAFNGDLSGWDVASAMHMGGMFYGAEAFEGIGLGNWDVSNVQHMYGMFEGATNFNQNLCAWGLSFVAKSAVVADMFIGASICDVPQDTPTITVVDGSNVLTPMCQSDCLDGFGVDSSPYTIKYLGETPASIDTIAGMLTIPLTVGGGGTARRGDCPCQHLPRV